MLSLPDFKEKQLLFVSAKNAEIEKIKFLNDNICLSKDGKIVNRISCHKVFALFLIGDCSLTSVLVRNCADYGVSIFLLKNNFLNYARLLAQADGNYLLRERQYAATEEQELAAAKILVANKISNQICLLESSDGKDAALSLEKIKAKIKNARNGKDLLGLEGAAGKFFFQSYFKNLEWKRRLPRAKIDIPNYLMDMGYTMLFNFVEAMLGIYGFDVYRGFYHKLFFQRKSLACDLMEPFRCVIDKQIMKSHNLGQIKANDFKLSKGVYGLGFEEQKKYAEIFAQAIMDRREDIFCYARDYYYFTINGAEFPAFKMK
ncbi:MAG: type V CRISPR-associated endonuclease Cas1 [Candidatus Nealsonbacteria bacterium DGGOD1a]|jgi:CRISPR-associated protein Cas1|nr:MAG: type V CRISPR-associated endonuclease Cas1 [Candidatus Nealsonbacteria bacterium DGGOD1a]